MRCQGTRVRGLNDLTWSGGLVWANVARHHRLAGIDLDTGEVTDVVDARAAAERHGRDPQAVMNGIAAARPPRASSCCSPARAGRSAEAGVHGPVLVTGTGWRWIRRSGWSRAGADAAGAAA